MFNPERLREARNGRQIEEIAVATRRAVSTIRSWERGETEPRASDLAVIAALIRKPISWFFEPVRRLHRQK